MNTPRILLLLLLTAGAVRAQAQDNPAPAAATEPAQTEMQKWIATTDTQWQAVFNREVTDVHAAELKDLALKYAAALDGGIAKASTAGDLNDALVLRDEKKRFADTNVFPEKDDDADAASLKVIRAAIRVQLAKLETANAARAKAVHAKYDAVLAQAQTQLTQRQRLDDGLLVQAKRDEVAAAWITPAVAAVAEKGTAPAVPVKNPPTPVPPKVTQAQVRSASMETKLVGTKWTFPVTGQPAENQWIEFRDGGVLAVGWGAGLRKWNPLSEGRVQIHPFQSASFSFVLSIDASLRSGKILEGEHKGEKIGRAK